MDRQELLNLIYDNMNAAKRAMHGRMQAFVGECPISRGQMELLFTLHHMQPTSPKRLGEEMRLSPGAISQQLESLVELGFVERRHDPADRRALTIQISKSGLTKLSEMAKKRNKLMQGVLAELTTEELKVLLSVQQKLTNKFSALNKETGTKEK